VKVRRLIARTSVRVLRIRWANSRATIRSCSAAATVSAISHRRATHNATIAAPASSALINPASSWGGEFEGIRLAHEQAPGADQAGAARPGAADQGREEDERKQGHERLVVTERRDQGVAEHQRAGGGGDPSARRIQRGTGSGATVARRPESRAPRAL